MNQNDEKYRIFAQVKRIASIFLSLLILASSMGITYSTHYCMDRAVESRLMIGHHDLSCGMMEMDTNCDTERAVLMAPGCCDNASFAIEIEDDYQIESEHYSLESSFIFAFTYAFLINNPRDVEQHVAHTDQYPPPLKRDYQSMYQSFLL